ncbi:MAG: diacylglycerol kinase family lipid kinase [Planctomycetota bacterium]|nr:diacylglycerol kinase family lipid kinase [Planctomycetota bacterium]
MSGEDSDSRTISVVFNPVSGLGAGRVALRDLTDRLSAFGMPYQVTETGGPGDGAAVARAADPEHCRAILIIGGDGTINDVMNGPVPRGVPIGLIPFGTGNVLSTALRLPRSPAELVDAVRGKRTRQIDLVERDGRRFASVAGIGFDAYVVEELSRHRSGNIRKWSYAVPILRAMARYRFPAIRVRVDSRTIGENFGMVILGNVWNYGGILRVAPRARPDDGLIDVCIFGGRKRTDLLRYAAALPFGLHLAYPDVRYLRGKEVLVEATEGGEIPVELDGDPGGTLPARFRVLPLEATLLVA